MAVGPDNQVNRPEEALPQEESSTPVGEELGHFGERLRLHGVENCDGLSFDVGQGHEDWHQSLRYPQ